MLGLSMGLSLGVAARAISAAAVVDYLAPALAIPGVQYVGGPGLSYQETDNSSATPALVGDAVGTMKNRMTSGGLVLSSVNEGDRPALVSRGGELLVEGGGPGTTVHLATTVASAHPYAKSIDMVFAFYVPPDSAGGTSFAPHSQVDTNAWRFSMGVAIFSNPETLNMLGIDLSVVSAATFLDKVGIMRIRVLHDSTSDVTTLTSWINGGAPVQTTAASDTGGQSMRGFTLLNLRATASQGSDTAFGPLVYVAGQSMSLASANAASDWIASELNVDPRTGAMT
jgi:hypothetical protein